VCIAVIVFAYQYARWLHPFVERVATYVLTLRHEALVFLSAEQGCQVVVQPSASVVAGIDDGRFLLTVLVAQQFAIYRAEALAVHTLYVYVCYLSV